MECFRRVNSGGECGAPREERRNSRRQGVPREAFQPGDLEFPQISAPARGPRPLLSPSGNTPKLSEQTLMNEPDGGHSTGLSGPPPGGGEAGAMASEGTQARPGSGAVLSAARQVCQPHFGASRPGGRSPAISSPPPRVSTVSLQWRSPRRDGGGAARGAGAGADGGAGEGAARGVRRGRRPPPRRPGARRPVRPRRAPARPSSSSSSPAAGPPGGAVGRAGRRSGGTWWGGTPGPTGSPSPHHPGAEARPPPRRAAAARSAPERRGEVTPGPLDLRTGPTGTPAAGGARGGGVPQGGPRCVRRRGARADVVGRAPDRVVARRRRLLDRLAGCRWPAGGPSPRTAPSRAGREG